MAAVVDNRVSALGNVSHSLRQGADKLFNFPLNAVRALTASCEGVKNYFVPGEETRAGAAYRIGHDVGTAARRAGHWLRHDLPTIAKREIRWAIPCAALTLGVKASLVGSGVMASGGMAGFAASLAVGAVTTTAFRAVRERMTADEAYQNMAAARQGSLVSHFSRTARLTPLFMRHAYGALAHDGLLKNATFWKKVAMNAAFGGACVGLMEASGLSHAIGNVMRSAIGNAHAGDARSLGYGPGALEQPTYGSGPTETVSGAGELKMYVPPVDEGEGEIDLLKLYRHTPPSAPPAAAELPPIELESYKAIHAGDTVSAPHDGIAVDAPQPIAPMDVQSQVRALLESGELDKKTAKMARAFLGNGQGTLSQRGHDFALELLKHHPTPQETELAHSLITDAANHGNKSAQKTVEYLARHGKFGFGATTPASPPPPVTTPAVPPAPPQPVAQSQPAPSHDAPKSVSPKVVAVCNVSAATGVHGITNPVNVCSPLPDTLGPDKAIQINYPDNTGIPASAFTMTGESPRAGYLAKLSEVLDTGNRFVDKFNEVSAGLRAAAARMIPRPEGRRFAFGG